MSRDIAGDLNAATPALRPYPRSFVRSNRTFG